MTRTFRVWAIGYHGEMVPSLQPRFGWFAALVGVAGRLTLNDAGLWLEPSWFSKRVLGIRALTLFSWPDIDGITVSQTIGRESFITVHTATSEYSVGAYSKQARSALSTMGWIEHDRPHWPGTCVLLPPGREPSAKHLG
jgi:hypothetical protein